ncbi:MAG TPA: S9 family peptidase [Longimicrobiales bacterium]|nr:S9 family peptidase [Longimicrobiales bacterium]
MRPTLRPLSAFLLLFVSAVALSAQELSVERIFASSELSPEGLPETRWMPDGRGFTYLAANPQGGTDLALYDVSAGIARRLVDGSSLVPGGERRPIDIEGYEWFADGTRLLVFTRSERVWRENTKGFYFVYDLADGSLQPISIRQGFQMFAKPSPDGTRVAFVRDNDLFMTDLGTGEETRLTRDGSDVIINGTFDWVYEEELGLRDGWRWSPDGARIAFWQLDQTPIRTFHMIDDLQLYSEPIPLPYPKAGDPNSFARIGVLDLGTMETTWMDTGDNPDVYLARMEWAGSSDEVVIQRMSRHQDRIDVMLGDVRTGATRVLFTEESDTWVDVDLDMTWVADGSEFLWTSERDGFEHLYLYARDGTLRRQLTRGPWDAEVPHALTEDGWVYFTAAKEGPLERHLYRVRLSGGDVERVTSEEGTHQVDMAPGGRFFIDTRSRNGDPPVISLRTGEGDTVRTLVDNQGLRDRLAVSGARPPEFFTFRTSDGVELNGWMIKPPAFDASRRYPLVMYVYGGPGSQTAADEWGGNRYLWHQLLAQEGFIVASVDNRGTGGRGRDFKNVTYLDLGSWESRDQIEVAGHLAGLPYVDAARIAIWGWSYGGYMTLMSMMKGGDVFAAGIAVAPVTSWRFYDTIYTERYMRTPRENPDGYRRSAPLENVQGLTGDLLLVHGTGDDNVHFQNSVQLVDRLQAAGKQFRLMVYPNKTHSIAGTDTQVHLYTMMTDFLKERLMGSAPSAP